jgi:hypothetical protein
VRPWTLILASACLATGCAQQSAINPNNFRGRELAEVARVYHLDQYQNLPTMNRPPGADAEVTYFLPKGNLIIDFTGQPEVVDSAEFLPAETSSDARFKQASDAWDAYVAEHEAPHR